MQDLEQIARVVREVLLGGVLKGSDPSSLDPTTRLLTDGVLDSVATVTLIGDLEQRLGVSFEAFEMSIDYLDSIEAIAKTIHGKLSGPPA